MDSVFFQFLSLWNWDVTSIFTYYFIHSIFLEVQQVTAYLTFSYMLLICISYTPLLSSQSFFFFLFSRTETLPHILLFTPLSKSTLHISMFSISILVPVNDRGRGGSWRNDVTWQPRWKDTEQDSNTSQSDTQIQCSIYQNPNNCFFRMKKTILKYTQK